MIGYLVDAFSGPAGAFMYALLAVLAFAIAVVIERSLTFYRDQVDAELLLKRLEAAVTGSEKPAWGNSPAERVLQEGLRWTEADLAWEAMSGEAVLAEQQIRRRVGYLATVASIATMLGLFGTVYGLILAFGALGDVAAAERAARLSEGSSTAMATTAFGLLVAIPALAAHAVLEATVRDRLATIERLSSRLVLLLKARR